MKECSHLHDFINSKQGLTTYQLLHNLLVISGSDKKRQTKILKSFCPICDKREMGMHTCMHCSFFGCTRHIREHNKNMAHTFAMDFTYRQVHCSECGDYVYDDQLDRVGRGNALKGDVVKKSVLELIWPTLPSENKGECSSKTETMALDKSTHIGLRGLLNLGSICFMNCVIQVLTHTPVLKDYFFTDHHRCEGKCIITNLFRDFYTGEKTPLVLNEFLHLIWSQVGHSAGYEKQDAREFFKAALDVLHNHCSATLPPEASGSRNKVDRCLCIIEQVFTGSLQSDLVCQKCNGVSTTIDPMWDYSLDFTPCTTDESLPTSLEDCLARFTGAEILGGNYKIFCENCQSYQEATKQFTMRTLPVVLCFHLKRVQHFNGLEKKVSSTIRFPEFLDMTPFRTKQKSDSVLHVPYDNKYVLFAVINHVGTSINAGHYISHIRHQDRFWYTCNDSVITEIGIKKVLKSEGYMLFYHKCC